MQAPGGAPRPSSARNAQPAGWRDVLLALALGVAAASLALALGGSQELWFDEIGSVSVAARGHESLWHLLAYCGGADVHPPGFYALLSGWTAALGTSTLVLRLFAGLAFAGAVTMTALVGRVAFGRAAGALAAVTFGALPVALHYGVEVRMYGLLLLAVTGSLFAALGVHAGRRGAALGLGFFLCLGVLTHYLFLPFAAAIVGTTLLIPGLPAARRGGVVVAATWAAAVLGGWASPLLYQLRDLPAGFTAHLARGPSLGTVLALDGPGAGTGPWTLQVAIGAIFALGGLTALLLSAWPSGVAPEPADRTFETAPLLNRRRWAGLVLASVAGVALPALLIAQAPLPEVVADLWTTYMPWGMAAAPAAAVAGVVLAWLAGRWDHRRFVRAETVLAWISLFALVFFVGLALARSVLNLRNVLPFLPLVSIFVVGAVHRRFGFGLTLLVVTASVALSLASVLAGDVYRRPDPAGVVAVAEKTPDVPVVVLPQWETTALRYYDPDIGATGVDDPIGAAALVRSQGESVVVLGRWADPLGPLYEASITTALEGEMVVCGRGRVRGFRWLRICPR